VEIILIWDLAPCILTNHYQFVGKRTAAFIFMVEELDEREKEVWL
jgi:hypothetical protein